MARPSIFVTQPIDAGALARLRAVGDVELNPDPRHIITKPELLATAPNQLWSWDITKLLGPTKWTYY